MTDKQTKEFQGESQESIEDAVNQALAKAKGDAYSHYEILETFGLRQEQDKPHYQATVKVFCEN